MGDYLLDISASGRVFRYSNFEYVRRVDNADGQVSISYLPFIISIDVGEVEYALDEKGRIPTVRMTLWDGSRDFASFFTERDYEASEVRLYELIDGEEKTVFIGYLTDLSVDQSEVSFTVRVDEDLFSSKEHWTRFRASSFQYWDVRKPLKVATNAYWNIDEDLVFEIASYNLYKNVPPEDPDDPTQNDWYGAPIEVPTVTTPRVFKRYFDIGEWYGLKDYDLPDIVWNVTEPDGGLIESQEDTSGNNYLKFFFNAEGKIQAAFVELFDPANGLLAMGWPNSKFYEVIGYEKIGQFGNHANNISFSKPTYMSPTGGYDSIDRSLIPRTGAPIRPIKDGKLLRDTLIVKVDKFAPVDVLDNPEFSMGFLMFSDEVGERYRILSRDFINDVKNKRDRVFRYRIIDQSVIDNEQYLMLEIHCSHGMDERRMAIAQKNASREQLLYDPFAYNHTQTKDIFPTFNKIQPGVKLYNAELTRQVKRIDFTVDNNFINSSYDPSRLRNRLRGRRLEVIRDVADFQALSRGSNEEREEKEVNLNILNNTTGEFALARSSRVFYDQSICSWVERVEFDTMPNSFSGGTLEFILDEPEQDDLWPNYLQFKIEGFSWEDLTERHSYLFSNKSAEDHFKKKRFRVINNPVPKDGNDLGRFFPISYGYIKRHPMLHCISSDISLSDEAKTSGNDVYVIAKNSCNIHSSSDILIELENEQERVQKLDRGFSNFNDHIVESPFPVIIRNHRQVGRNGRLVTTDLKNPYHTVKRVNTIDGQSLLSVQLSGDMWNSELGRADKRYPIRNGVGNTKLLASYAGERDVKTGRTIVHPCDVFVHFFQRYSDYEYSGFEIDLDSFQLVKSLTPRYFGSFVFEEDIGPLEILDEICDQFGYRWVLDGASIGLRLVEPGLLDPVVDISHLGHIVGDVSEDTEGYKDIYDSIIYRYNKNAKGNYDNEIVLNKQNNRFCAKVASAKGGKGAYEVDGSYVYSRSVAYDIASRLASTLCRRRRIYKCSVKRDVVNLRVGEVITLTYPPLGIEGHRMVVTSIKKNPRTLDLKLLKIE